MADLERITFDPKMMQGKPCVRGMRITVGLVVNLVANGMSMADILRNYPDLEEEDVRQCLRYAAAMVEDEAVPSRNSDLDDDLIDQLIESNTEFREVLAESNASGRRPFKRKFA